MAANRAVGLALRTPAENSGLARRQTRKAQRGRSDYLAQGREGGVLIAVEIL